MLSFSPGAEDRVQRTWVSSRCTVSLCPQSNACYLLLTHVCTEENVSTTQCAQEEVQGARFQMCGS